METIHETLKKILKDRKKTFKALKKFSKRTEKIFKSLEKCSKLRKIFEAQKRFLRLTEIFLNIVKHRWRLWKDSWSPKICLKRGKSFQAQKNISSANSYSEDCFEKFFPVRDFLAKISIMAQNFFKKFSNIGHKFF